MSQTQLVAVPQSIDAQVQQAEIWSKSSIVPDSYKNKPADILVAVAMGQELGFKALQSLQLINVISGRPALSLNAYMALCRQHGGRYEVVESSDKSCEVKVYRGEEGWSEKFTLLDAQAQGLLGKPNWQKMPKQMLFARALSQAIRRLFADVVNGLYAAEELLDGDERPTVVAEAPAKRTRKAKEEPGSTISFEEAEIEELPEQPPLPFADAPVERPRVKDEVFKPTIEAHRAELSFAFSKVFGKIPSKEQLDKLGEKVAAEKPDILVGEFQNYLEAKKAATAQG